MTYTTKQLITYIIATAIVFAVIGLFGGRMIDTRKGEPLTGQNTFEAGLKAAAQRLIARGHADIAFLGYGLNESKMIGGTIKEINNGKITLSVSPVNALAPLTLDERTITISASTKIYQLVPKTMDEMKKDMEAFSKTMEALPKQQDMKNQTKSVEPPMPPEPFAKKEITMNDLKIGQNINVTASDFVQNKKEFVASEVEVRVGR